jgi:hypothetical protein
MEINKGGLLEKFEMHTSFLSENLKGRDHFVDRSVGGRIIQGTFPHIVLSSHDRYLRILPITYFSPYTPQHFRSSSCTAAVIHFLKLSKLATNSLHPCTVILKEPQQKKRLEALDMVIRRSSKPFLIYRRIGL